MAAESKTKIICIYCHCSQKWGGGGTEGRARLKTIFEKVDSRRQRKQSGRRLPFHRPAGVLHSCHKCLLSFEAKSQNTTPMTGYSSSVSLLVPPFLSNHFNVLDPPFLCVYTPLMISSNPVDYFSLSYPIQSLSGNPVISTSK